MAFFSRPRNRLTCIDSQPVLECRVMLATPTQSSFGNGFSVSGNQLMFNGAPYEVLGVGYSAENLGYPLATGGYMDPESIYDLAYSDFKTIAETGANTVRIYDPFFEVPGAFNVINRAAADNNLKLLVGFPTNNPTGIADFVRTHQNNSNIAGYVVGNEVNFNAFYGTSGDPVGTAGYLSNVIRENDGDNHPIISSYGEIPPAEVIRGWDEQGSFDLHSTNYYREPTGHWYEDGLTEFAGLTNKPVLVLEYGHDSYVDHERRSDLAGQAGLNRVANDKLSRLLDDGVLAGVSAFGYKDQIYRSDGGNGVATYARGGGKQDRDPATWLGYGPDPNNPINDGVLNDEHLGLTTSEGSKKPAYDEATRFFGSRKAKSSPISASEQPADRQEPAGAEQPAGV